MATSKGTGEALDAATEAEESDKLPVVASIGDVTYTEKARHEADLAALRDNVENAKARLEAAETYVDARKDALKAAEAELAAAEGD